MKPKRYVVKYVVDLTIQNKGSIITMGCKNSLCSYVQLNNAEIRGYGTGVITIDTLSYGTIDANNVKLDNETRIRAVEAKLNNIFNLIYPVGSIYTSMNNTNPSNLFGGTWTDIVDAFMYCVDPSGGTSGSTGGSKKITVDQLPPHHHNVTTLRVRGNENCSDEFTITRWGGNDFSFDTDDTGNGDDYMPPYMTVYA